MRGRAQPAIGAHHDDSVVIPNHVNSLAARLVAARRMASSAFVWLCPTTVTNDVLLRASRGLRFDSSGWRLAKSAWHTEAGLCRLRPATPEAPSCRS